MSEKAEYVTVSKNTLLELKNAIEDFAKEHDEIKKDLERLKALKG